MSVVSFTVTFSGLTDTMGGSETQTNFDFVNPSKISDRGHLLLQLLPKPLPFDSLQIHHTKNTIRDIILSN